MAIPDFSKKTIDTLSKRARFQCSNPDCGVETVGPNSDPSKATTIGEAAHIYGARPISKRYDSSMSDVTRADITNGIWLCKNCHGKIDRDETEFPAQLLFYWRREHEERALNQLGNRSDRMRSEIEESRLEFLSSYPSIIQRIVRDKPRGWEWRLTAELMRHLNKPQLKRLENLRLGHYYKLQPKITDDEFNDWLSERTNNMSNLIDPLVGLLERLNASWGCPGEAGDMEEIHDVCVMIRDLLCVAIDHEEDLKFSYLPEHAEGIRDILLGAVGNNLSQLSKVPQKLDEMVSMIETDHEGTLEKPKIVKLDIVFDVPKNFNRDFNKALKRYERSAKGWF